MGNLIRKLGDHLAAMTVLLMTWVIFAGQVDPPVLAVGSVIIVITVIVLPASCLQFFSHYAIRRLFFLVLFMLYMLFEVFLASYKIAFLAFHPSVDLHSSIFAYDYTLESRVGIFLLSTVITLTPGTLVLDISTEKKRLYIHMLGRSKDKESTWDTIELMETWLRRIFL